MPEGDLERTITVQPGPEAVAEVRRLVRSAVSDAPDAAELMVDAELVASELVTNAILHAAPPVRVRVQATSRGLRVEVVDSSRTPLIRLVPTDDSMTGRGLSIVQALARSWGVDPTPDGKVVWCELDAHPSEPPTAADTSLLQDPDEVDALLSDWDDDEIGWDDLDALERQAGTQSPAAPAQRYTVHIGDVSTDLLRAAKGHVDNLVREVALAQATVDVDQSDDARNVAELMQTVVVRFGEARTALKVAVAEAAARGETRTDLVLTLPLSAADAGEAYLEALDEVDRYARAARLLTLETPPQHRAFRHWYVETLIQQLRSAAGIASPLPLQTFEERLLDELDVLAVAQRESARGARLQQVTASLAGAVTTEDVVLAVVSEGVSALRASGGTVLIPDEAGHLRAPAVIGYSEPVIRRLNAESAGDRLPGAVALATGEAVWVEHAQERDERFPDLREIEPSACAVCALPLRVRDRTVGVLRFSFDRPRLFDEAERRFILTLAAQTAQSLDRAQALDRAQQATDRLEFLAEASATLAEDLDHQQTLASIARLVVPRLADWCAVQLLEDGDLRSVAVAHVDPEKVAWAEQLQERYPADPDAPTGAAAVARSGRGELYAEVTDEMLVAGAVDDEQLALLRGLGMSSALVVPLVGRGASFGALTMIQAESGRRYGPTDLALAEDLAHRAGLAVETARLFQQASS